MTRLLAVMMCACWLLFSAAPAATAATCPKTSLLDIQDEVMCVICGTPLVNAGGPQSDDQRDFIRERVDRCESKAQIKQALVAEYGTEVLAMPQKSGFSLAAYLVPLIGLVVALAAISAGAVRWRRNARSGAEEAEPGEGAAAIDSDLHRYDL